MSEGGSIQAMLTAIKNKARRPKTGNKSIMGMLSGSLYKKGIKQHKQHKAHVEALKTIYEKKRTKRTTRTT
jgi:hypothetical protein